MNIRVLLSLVVFALVSGISAQSTTLDITLLLEGPYQQDKDGMSTTLHELGYLPGMEPKSFFGVAVGAEDPYDNRGGLKSNVQVDVSLYSNRSVDWVQVVIADASDRTVWASTLLVESDGHVVTDHIDNLNLPAGSQYQITVRHRNHLPVTSPLLGVLANRLVFDFTRQEVPGAKEIAGRYVLRGGQLSGVRSTDLLIDMGDIDTWSSSVGQNSTYLHADIDMDGDVSVHDKSIILSNLEASSAN